jgi:exosortase A-associated hydrolase 2
MSTAQPVRQWGGFVPGVAGARLRLITEPEGRSPRGTVVAIPAFAEEMNKTRRMCARLARRLAADGWRVVQTDPHGCGDSAGDFRDAAWATWLDDLRADLAQIDIADPLWLWGVRAGALLATSLLPVRPDANLLLWQPVLSGAQHLQQFLRLHAGARIVGSGGAHSESPARQLRDGRAVEVGGYEIDPALASGLEQAAFDVPVGFAGRIVWFELTAEPGSSPSLPATRLAERLAARQVDVEIEGLQGPLFWQTQEIEQCEALLERSVVRLAAIPRPRRDHG